MPLKHSNIGLALLATGLLATASASAGVYKCATADGGYEYRQIACDSENTGEVKIVDPTVPLSRSKPESGEADASSLRGDWCEFAVSLDLDGEKDFDRPATWYFGEDYATYLIRGAELRPGQELPKMPLKRDGQTFGIDHPFFASGRPWTVVGREQGVIVVRGTSMGYYFFRPGRC